MKKLLQLLILTTTLTGLNIIAESRSAFACYSNPLTNIKVGDSIATVLRDLLNNGNCGEVIIVMPYDEGTFLVCAPFDSTWQSQGKALKFLVRDWIVTKRKTAKLNDRESAYLCDF